MRLGRFGDGSLVVAIGDGAAPRVLDVKAVAPDSVAGADRLAAVLGPSLAGSWRPLIERWDELREPLELLVERAEAGELEPALRDPDENPLGAPVPCSEARIFALGGNFEKHIHEASKVALGIDDDAAAALERRRAQGPWGFMILPETVTGHGARIQPPRGIQKLDYEGEVAIVLREGGRERQASELSVWGFGAFNDFSLRDTAFQLGEPYDAGPMAWTLQKNFDTGSSLGPWIVVDEPFDTGDLDILLRVNGEVRQEGNTSEMIFSFGETFEHLSRFLTLKPCDMLASGTPSGTALESGVDGPFLRDGDVTEVEVEGAGVLRNSVVAAA